MLDEYRNARYKSGGRGERVGGIRLFDCYESCALCAPSNMGCPRCPAMREWPLMICGESTVRSVKYGKGCSRAMFKKAPWHCAGRESLRCTVGWSCLSTACWQ